MGLNNGPLIPKKLDRRDHVFAPVKALALRAFAAKLRVRVGPAPTLLTSRVFIDLTYFFAVEEAKFSA